MKPYILMLASLAVVSLLAQNRGPLRPVAWGGGRKLREDGL